jgi:large subunit ribosomal protein L4e
VSSCELPIEHQRTSNALLCHRISLTCQKRRFAVVSALPSLVVARGHRIEKIEEVPLVVGEVAESLKKPEEVVALLKALGHLPGAEVAEARRLNLLQLAPGRYLGRFVILTEGAFAAIDEVFGTFDEVSAQKKNYL